VFVAGWPNKLDVPPNPDCAAGRLRDDANIVGAGSEGRSMRDEGFCRRCWAKAKQVRNAGRSGGECTGQIPEAKGVFRMTANSYGIRKAEDAVPKNASLRCSIFHTNKWTMEADGAGEK
jgi:hypothetical protein